MQILINILLFSVYTFTSSNYCDKVASKDSDIHQLWLDCNLREVLSFDVFNTAMMGYSKISEIPKRNTFIIIDFSKPSSEKDSL